MTTLTLTYSILHHKGFLVSFFYNLFSLRLLQKYPYLYLAPHVNKNSGEGRMTLVTDGISKENKI